MPVSGVMTNDTSKTGKIKKMVITFLQHIAEMPIAAKLLSPFLADRTNGRAHATLLRLSVVVCLTYVLWLNGAS